MTTFTKVDDYYTFTFPHGVIIRIDELPHTYDDAYIDSLKNIIDGINGSKYDVRIQNDYNLIFKIINNNIKISLKTDFMIDNPDDKYLKPYFEFTINHDDCVDALKVFHNNIIKNIEDNMC
jgi:hypothetical protein